MHACMHAHMYACICLRVYVLLHACMHAGMSDEEFWGILGLSEDVGPRAVFNALSKWRKENKTSPLAPKLHRKWLEVFEKRLLQQLQQLQQQEEIAAKRDTWSSRFFRLLLGGDTLNAAQPRDL